MTDGDGVPSVSDCGLEISYRFAKLDREIVGYEYVQSLNQQGLAW